MKILNISLAVLLCSCSLAYAEELATKVGVAPIVESFTPESSRIDLSAGIWPEYVSGGDSPCIGYLLSTYGRPFSTKATPRAKTNGSNEFQATDLIYSLNVPVEYRKGSVLVTWTLRVEAQDPPGLKAEIDALNGGIWSNEGFAANPYDCISNSYSQCQDCWKATYEQVLQKDGTYKNGKELTPADCNPPYDCACAIGPRWRGVCGGQDPEGHTWPWHGGVTYTIVGGKVKSRVYLQYGNRAYEEYGQPSEMSIPDGGTAQSTDVSDPTHSGSYVFKASDFGGDLPAVMNFKIYWKNETARNIFSRAGYRTLIVTLMPES